jgi:hypothetical protein
MFCISADQLRFIDDMAVYGVQQSAPVNAPAPQPRDIQRIDAKM